MTLELFHPAFRRPSQCSRCRRSTTRLGKQTRGGAPGGGNAGCPPARRPPPRRSQWRPRSSAEAEPDPVRPQAQAENDSFPSPRNLNNSRNASNAGFKPPLPRPVTCGPCPGQCLDSESFRRRVPSHGPSSSRSVSGYLDCAACICVKIHHNDPLAAPGRPPAPIRVGTVGQTRLCDAKVISLKSSFGNVNAFNSKKLKLSLSPGHRRNGSRPRRRRPCGWGATAGKFLRQTKGRTVFGHESFDSIRETSRRSLETCTWAILRGTM